MNIRSKNGLPIESVLLDWTFRNFKASKSVVFPGESEHLRKQVKMPITQKLLGI